jgi:hypothetical protein
MVLPVAFGALAAGKAATVLGPAALKAAALMTGKVAGTGIAKIAAAKAAAGLAGAAGAGVAAKKAYSAIKRRVVGSGKKKSRRPAGIPLTKPMKISGYRPMPTRPARPAMKHVGGKAIGK